MITWTIRRAQSSAVTKGTTWKSCIATTQCLRSFTSSGRHAQQETNPRRGRSPLERRYPVFTKFEPPRRDVASWTALLDGALPPHLRDVNVSPPLTVLSAAEVAQILLAAQYPLQEQEQPLDLLFHLGFEQNRWSAVVWLIKKLVDKFPARHGAESPLSGVGSVWQNTPKYSDLGLQPLEFDATTSEAATQSVTTRSLDKLLDGLHPETKSHEDTLRHDALGQVWRTLGAMTKACSGGDTRAEVLEIIAYLHHREVMPLAIYQAEPNPDKTAIQQPPLIPFLSSRILTSVSDAAWRAHEKLVIEEARANGSQYAALRPELPGTVFRVHVAGLRPEVWMELILWSCLYGGWIRQGSEVLRSLIKDRESPWTPLSWTDYQKSLPQNYRTEPRDWRSWEYIFKTRSQTSMDDPQPSTTSVDRTISSEVVNAFADALICTVNVGVGARGADIDEVVAALHDMGRFMADQRQDLSFGTWDALVLRLLDTHSATPETDSGIVQRLVGLSSGFGAGLHKRNTHHLPAYVRDGSMATQGVLHRALYGQIATGSFEGALEVFKLIQYRADKDKFASVATFFGRFMLSAPQDWKVRRNKNSLFQALNRQEMFTSNLPSIEYPSFDVQIPPTILAPFLDQITEAGALDFGRWLLYKTDVDGPVIRESSYNDPNLQPALVRFAAASNDRKLLASFKGSQLARASLRAILDSQIQRLNWAAAVEILNHLPGTPDFVWDAGNLAVAVRTMLQQIAKLGSDDSKAPEHLEDARTLVKDMITLKYDGNRTASTNRAAAIQSILSVLAAVDTKWFHFAYDLRPIRGHHDFALTTKQFNILLDGVVTAYGSAAGRRLLGIFWPHSARGSHDAAVKLIRNPAMRRRMPRARPEILDSIKRQRIIVAPPGQSDLYKFIGYGALTPNTNTILIILRKALQEAQSISQETAPVDDQTVSMENNVDGSADKVDLSPRGMVAWAVRRTAELPYVESSIIEQLDKVLVQQGMEDFRSELPKIYANMEQEVSGYSAGIDREIGSAESESNAFDEIPFSDEKPTVTQSSSK
ncbi:hypothetical protein Slin15195_G089400 [Septoria linicola]|uniref:Uncharacterized protein n=1 Tax=Septoria linicola TaxID=215465 RepID=A0A9Q9ELB1_9PEZI|nr:hypothetical protein Slin14017_G092060 [Septoria linicola]USW55621.1 hypothetical protein Slin15195_G089400 [Septoria linicola]